MADGQEIWDRELKRLGVGDPPREALAERFHAARFEDFLAALGRGDVSVPQLAGALQPYLPAPPPPAPKLAKRRRRRTGDVRISGVGDLLTQMAQCCKPLPNDPITGYITRGRGVSIHRADCRNVLGLAGTERARLIDVAWSAGAEETWPVEIAVEAYDRKGLLRDATTVVSNEGVNIVAMDSQTDPGHPRRRDAHHPRSPRRRAAQPGARPARAAPERIRLPAAGVAARRMSPGMP